MGTEPVALLSIPFLNDALRNGICLPEGDEVNRAGLTPVR